MVRLIKTLQQALKMDREKFKVPRSVQQAIPIQRIWPDGVFQSGTEIFQDLAVFAISTMPSQAKRIKRKCSWITVNC